MSRVSRRELLHSTGALLLAEAADPSTTGGAPPSSARLCYNESPFGPSSAARKALLAVGELSWKYSYEEVASLRDLIAGHERVRAENVFVSEGSGEILKLAAMLYAGPGQRVVTTRPTFIMLPQYASLRGATVGWVDVDRQFDHDFRAMQAAIDSSTSLVYVCNPNNPTGVLTDPDRLRAFVSDVSSRALVVVDEAYIDYAVDPEHASMLDMVRSGANVLVTRTFSKLYGLAGLRVGYGIASAAVIDRLESVRISIPNQAGVAAARASHADRAFRTGIRRVTGESLAFCSRLCDELKLRYVPSSANFMMFDSGRESTDFTEFARERGVMVAPVYEPLTTWVRVSAGRMQEMQAFARTLRAFLGQTGEVRSRPA